MACSRIQRISEERVRPQRGADDPDESSDDLRLLSEKDLARLTGFSVRSYQKWRVQGSGPPYLRFSSRCVRYRQREVQLWLNEKLRRSTSDPGGES